MKRRNGVVGDDEETFYDDSIDYGQIGTVMQLTETPDRRKRKKHPIGFLRGKPDRPIGEE